MLKKALFVVAGVAIVGVLMFGSSAYHMVRDFVSGVRNYGESMVSIDSKIKHTRSDIQSLSKDIKSMVHEIAIEESKCMDVKSEVKTKTEKLNKLQVHMRVLNEHLKSNGSQHYVATNGKSYSPHQVKLDLQSSLNRYRTQSKMLAAYEKQLESRQAILVAAKEKLEETQRIQAELLTELEALEAEHRMNEVAKISSEFKFDNNRLSRAKESLKKLRTEVRVEGNMVNQMQSPNSIPTEPIQTDDLDNVTAQYDALFGKSSGVVQK